MPQYMERAAELKRLVNKFMEDFSIDQQDIKCKVAEQLGFIINLAIRCNPRQPQGTVRLNIVREAIGEYCKVSMTKEFDENSGRNYNKIHIVPRVSPSDE